jgi:hypothetical protein
MGAFEFGNLGADVGAPLDQQMVVRNFLLRPFQGVGAADRKLLQAFLDHGQLGIKLIELCGRIHCCSPKLKEAQCGVSLRNAATYQVSVYTAGGKNAFYELADEIHGLLERAAIHGLEELATGCGLIEIREMDVCLKGFISKRPFASCQIARRTLRQCRMSEQLAAAGRPKWPGEDRFAAQAPRKQHHIQ